MAPYVSIGGLKVHQSLHDLVRDEIAPARELIPKRSGDRSGPSSGTSGRSIGKSSRTTIDCRSGSTNGTASEGKPLVRAEYRAFLEEIGYLVPEGGDFTIATAGVDREIATVAGPQLVVPVDNARYALNAANARWGSLYDALYGTDVISEADGAQRSGPYNPVRGGRVVAYAEAFLDKHVGLDQATYSEVSEFRLQERQGQRLLRAALTSGGAVGLADPAAFVGYGETGGRLTSVLLRHHGLHIELQLDRSHPVGKVHPAGLKDVVLEAAITTIIDCEDSVAAVDAEDKTRVYRNWFGIMTGTLEASFDKNGRSVGRQLNPDRSFLAPDGRPLTLSGRSLLLIRNVGIHMETDAVTTADDRPIPEGFLDAMMTGLAALPDLKGPGKGATARPAASTS